MKDVISNLTEKQRMLSIKGKGKPELITEK